MKYLLTLLSVVIIGGAAYLGDSHASDRQLSQKTLCHKTSAPGQPPYHWHIDDEPAKDIGGPCIKQDGKVVHQGRYAAAPEPEVVTPEAPTLITVPSDVYTDIVNERDDLRTEVAALKAQVTSERESAEAAAQAASAREQALKSQVQEARNHAENTVTEYQRLTQQVEHNLMVSKTDREDAAALHAEAAAREAGSGPAANRKCANALETLIINAKTGWLSDSVKVDEQGRWRLREACLR